MSVLLFRVPVDAPQNLLQEVSGYGPGSNQGLFGLESNLRKDTMPIIFVNSSGHNSLVKSNNFFSECKQLYIS